MSLLKTSNVPLNHPSYIIHLVLSKLINKKFKLYEINIYSF